jgi:hypothetical protein
MMYFDKFLQAWFCAVVNYACHVSETNTKRLLASQLFTIMVYMYVNDIYSGTSI